MYVFEMHEPRLLILKRDGAQTDVAANLFTAYRVSSFSWISAKYLFDVSYGDLIGITVRGTAMI